MAIEIIYQKSTETIRQMPQNYMLAKVIPGGRIVVDADVQVDDQLAVYAFRLSRQLDFRYGVPAKFTKALNAYVATREKAEAVTQ